MSRRSERRARREAINELLASQDPPSRLDRFDQQGRMPHSLDCHEQLQAQRLSHLLAQRPQIPEQAGPPRSLIDLHASARTR